MNPPTLKSWLGSILSSQYSEIMSYDSFSSLSKAERLKVSELNSLNFLWMSNAPNRVLKASVSQPSKYTKNCLGFLAVPNVVFLVVGVKLYLFTATLPIKLMSHLSFGVQLANV